MTYMSCDCGATVFERRECVRRAATGEHEVVYYRYRCVHCNRESQEFPPDAPAAGTEVVLVEAGARARAPGR